MSKKRIATTSLAGCFGCHMSLLDLDEVLLDLAQLVDFDRSPVDDLKHISQHCDVGIVEGGCANADNVEVLHEFRRNCDVLVSLGDCATMGGIPAMRNLVPLEECLAEAYRHGPSVHNPSGGIPGDAELPLLLDRVRPCHEVVHVDVHLPGCPPSAEAILQTLQALLQGRPVPRAHPLLKYD